MATVCLTLVNPNIPDKGGGNNLFLSAHLTAGQACSDQLLLHRTYLTYTHLMCDTDPFTLALP